MLDSSQLIRVTNVLQFARLRFICCPLSSFFRPQRTIAPKTGNPTPIGPKSHAEWQALVANAGHAEVRDRA